MFLLRLFVTYDFWIKFLKPHSICRLLFSSIICYSRVLLWFNVKVTLISQKFIFCSGICYSLSLSTKCMTSHSQVWLFISIDKHNYLLMCIQSSCSMRVTKPSNSSDYNSVTLHNIELHMEKHWFLAYCNKTLQYKLIFYFDLCFIYFTQ